MARDALLVLGLGGVLAACGGDAPEPTPDSSASQKAEPSSASTKPESSRASDDDDDGSSRIVWPWLGRAEARRAEIEAEVRQAEVEAEMKRAEAEVEQALAEVEKQHARLEAERAKLEAELAAAAGGSTTSTPSTEPPPMSRPEPEPTAVAAPPFGYTLVREAVLAQGPQPTLKKKSVRRNSVTDEAAWFALNGLSLPIWDLGGPYPASPDPRPSHITKTYRGKELARAIQSGGASVAIHAVARGRNLWAVARDPLGDVLGAVDLGAYERAPASGSYTDQELQWALVQDQVLFVCTYHRTYASSSGGLNAFITAFELPSAEMLWQSEPLVCNSHNFLLRDGWIITGYGFTAEPDFLYVLDARTGETASKTKVKSGPEIILEKGGELHVRTYDRDYVFEIK